jgi:hypothetical protein
MLYVIVFAGLLVLGVVSFSSLVPLLVPVHVGAAVAGVAITSLLLRLSRLLAPDWQRARAISAHL